MLPTLLRILLLTIFWVTINGSFGVGTVLVGGFLAWAILRISRPLFNPEERRVREGIRPVLRTWRSLVLLVVFLREVVLSAAQVAWFVLQPTLTIRPGIIEYPLDVTTDREIAALANMISLTPGTLSMDVSPDRTQLYIHAISVETDDGAEVVADIKRSLEKHVRRALGPRE